MYKDRLARQSLSIRSSLTHGLANLASVQIRMQVCELIMMRTQIGLPRAQQQIDEEGGELAWHSIHVV